LAHPTVDAGDTLPLTLPKLLAQRASEQGDALFVVVDDERLSYREAEDRSRVLARGLIATGVGRGTHVGLLHPNGAGYVVASLAAMRIGAIAVPLSTFSKPKEIAELVRHADIDVLLSAQTHRSHDYPQALRTAFPELDTSRAGRLWSTSAPTLRRIHFDPAPAGVHPDWTYHALQVAAESIPDPVLEAMEADVAPSDRMVVIHTSGSTSAPKGVVHTHGALLRHVDNLNANRRFDRSEILFSNSPWFWIGGFAYTLLGTLIAGARLVCSNSQHASPVLDLIERERPTMVNGFAQSVAHLASDPSFARRDLSSIRRGNLYPILPRALRPADPGLRHGMLGMTEAGSVCLDAPDENDLPEHQRGSFGRPAPGFESRIVESATGKPCPTGAIGELQLRGPFLMQGYLGRERHDTFTPDEWFAAGDLFHVDAAGLHYFHGRAGSMIKTAGANVSPGEVEAAITDLTGCTAIVIGLPDAERGQRVAAVVVSTDPVDLERLQAALRERLSSYKVPRILLQLRQDEVPLMSSGKLDPRALEKLFDGR
jgi:acyl-CoA synthetase (AMP-forming)/AMP-acid ligase II